MTIKNPWDDATNIKATQAEFRIQVAAVKHISTAFPNVMFTAFPGRPGDAQDGFFKKIMGTKAGVADLLLWYRQNDNLISAAIELKEPYGTWKTAQNKWASAFVSIGGKYAVCRSVKQVHDTLVKWGNVPKHTSIEEPDLRSETEKFRDNFDFYAPPTE
jgi:hypothetical protein